MGQYSDVEILAVAVRDTVMATTTARGVEFYSLPSEHPDSGSAAACYGLRLKAQVLRYKMPSHAGSSPGRSHQL